MIADKLLEKAKEAFVLAVEIYNKPTIKYRVEGFTFFICNAWELMLKAYLIKTKGEESIYYKDNPERTINLENCINKNINTPATNVVTIKVSANINPLLFFFFINISTLS